MAFNVNFYTFAKKSNSTARPTGTGEVISCILKTDSSIRNPVIILERGLASSPSWNYAYIPEYGRYYYINNWSWTDHRLWAADMTCDTLATFKQQIGDAFLYILRSSQASDGSIEDNYYPAKTTSIFQTLTADTPFTFNAQSGSFVVGIASGLHPTYGTTTYYLMDPTQLDALMSALNNDLVTVLNGFDTADATLALQKSLIDPFQFVTSCIWFPLDNADMPGIGSPRTVYAGGFPLSAANGTAINASTPLKEFTMSFTLPDHPQIVRGSYLNANYRKLFLELPPFGTVELDGNVACNYSKIIIKMAVDAISGVATIRIGCGNDNDITELLERYETRAGVPMQLTNNRSDWMGALTGAASGILGIAGGLAMHNPLGAIGNAVNGIGNIANSLRPRASHLGSTGSFASLANTVPQGVPTSYTVKAKLYIQFLNLVDEDNGHCGRPLCQIRQVSTLPGYLLVKDAELDLPGFSEEATEIREIMEAGFFYE